MLLRPHLIAKRRRMDEMLGRNTLLILFRSSKEEKKKLTRQFRYNSFHHRGRGGGLTGSGENSVPGRIPAPNEEKSLPAEILPPFFPHEKGAFEERRSCFAKSVKCVAKRKKRVGEGEREDGKRCSKRPASIALLSCRNKERKKGRSEKKKGKANHPPQTVLCGCSAPRFRRRRGGGGLRGGEK